MVLQILIALSSVPKLQFCNCKEYETFSHVIICYIRSEENLPFRNQHVWFIVYLSWLWCFCHTDEAVITAGLLNATQSWVIYPSGCSQINLFVLGAKHAFFSQSPTVDISRRFVIKRSPAATQSLCESPLLTSGGFWRKYWNNEQLCSSHLTDSKVRFKKNGLLCK